MIDRLQRTVDVIHVIDSLDLSSSIREFHSFQWPVEIIIIPRALRLTQSICTCFHDLEPAVEIVSVMMEKFLVQSRGWNILIRKLCNVANKIVGVAIYLRDK